MITSYGMCPQVRQWLRDNGYEVQCIEATPPEFNFNQLEPDWSVLDRVQLRSGQRECLEAFVEAKHGIISAPVGFGKTFLLSLLVQMYPTAKFHICTKSRDVLNEIYSRIQLVTPEVGMYCGGRKDLDSRITCITAASLGSLPADDVAFFIFDECHQAAANTYSEAIIDKYRFSRNYGFSATPKGRSDGADRALTFLFGDVIYRMDYNEGVSNNLVVPITVDWIHSDFADSSSSSWNSTTSKFRHLIWRNRHRNNLVKQYVENHCRDDQKVLVLVASVEHAVYLHKELPDFTMVYGDMSTMDLNFYMKHGLLPTDYEPIGPKDRKRLQEEFKNGELKRVIATDVWNTGVDFPDLDLVINASGRASSIMTTQGAGRGSRIFAGKTKATVVDFVDEFDGKTSSFYRGSSARRKTYLAQGWKENGWR